MEAHRENETSFINVDLDIEGPEDLAPFVRAFGDDVFDLYTGPLGPRFQAHLELSGEACQPADAETALRGFLRLLERLTPENRRRWDTATTRDFNIGIRAGATPHAFEFALLPDTLAAVAHLGARVVVTVYAPDFAGRSAPPPDELDSQERPAEGRPMPRSTKSRIMYVEYKGDGLAGTATISRVTFSKTGRTVYYRGRSLQSLNGSGYKASHFDVETGEQYWVSGPRKDGFDPLYPAVVEIDDDVRVEYWTTIRARPESVDQKSFRTNGKHPRRAHETGRRLD